MQYVILVIWGTPRTTQVEVSPGYLPKLGKGRFIFRCHIISFDVNPMAKRHMKSIKGGLICKPIYWTYILLFKFLFFKKKKGIACVSEMY